IEGAHYKKVKVDDSLSSKILDKYINQLDQGRSYLLASDIKSFEKFRLTFDDDLRAGDLTAFFHIFNVFQARYADRLKYSTSQVDKPFDFTKNETFTYNREKLPWL